MGQETNKHLDKRKVKSRKWIWTGHVSRIRDNRRTSCITTGTPYEWTRSRGRPARDGDVQQTPTAGNRLAERSARYGYIWKNTLMPLPNHRTMRLHTSSKTTLTSMPTSLQYWLVYLITLNNLCHLPAKNYTYGDAH